MDAVWQAIGGLSVDLKMALLLRDLVGLSYAEIAEALDTTLATVKWRIYKARETVVAELLREGYDFGHRARRRSGRRRSLAHPPHGLCERHPQPGPLEVALAGRAELRQRRDRVAARGGGVGDPARRGAPSGSRGRASPGTVAAFAR